MPRAVRPAPPQVSRKPCALDLCWARPQQHLVTHSAYSNSHFMKIAALFQDLHDSGVGLVSHKVMGSREIPLNVAPGFREPSQKSQNMYVFIHNSQLAELGGQSVAQCDRATHSSRLLRLALGHPAPVFVGEIRQAPENLIQTIWGNLITTSLKHL